jgi:hypothetical protein
LQCNFNRIDLIQHWVYFGRRETLRLIANMQAYHTQLGSELLHNYNLDYDPDYPCNP